MQYPCIRHLSDIVPFIENNPQFRISVQPNGYTIVCYMLQDEDTFTGENELHSKECRGITFDRDGNIASRTLHKFQNVGENAFTQPDQIPWDRIVRIMDKRDGSMITPVLIDGKVVCKTKKTFTSNEAMAATEFLHKDQDRVEWIRAILTAGYTPTFEWTSPRFPIVLRYEKDELTLLQIRENISGRYLSEGEIRFLLPTFKADLFPLVENLRQNFKDARDLLELAKTTEGVEGWIIQADDGQMWKIKTAWYIELHHSVTFTRWRDIARTVAADESDDLKGAFSMVGRSIEPILTVERGIKDKIDEIKGAVEFAVTSGREREFDVKTMALTYKDAPVFGLIMRAFRGQDINWMEYYAKTHLEEDWGLEVVA